MKFTWISATFLAISTANAATISVEIITGNSTTTAEIIPGVLSSNTSHIANGSNSTVCYTSTSAVNGSDSAICYTAPSMANGSNLTLASTATESCALVYAEPVSRLDQIIQSGVLRLGSAATGGYRPFIAQLSNGTNVGVDMDLGASLAAALGVRLEYVQSGWSSLMEDYRNDKFDIAMGGVSITLARQLRAYFSNGYLTDGKAPVTLCTNVGRYNTVAKMNQPGVRVDVFPGGTNEAWAHANIVPANIVMEPATGVEGQWLLDGRTDVMVTDLIEAEMLQHLHPRLCAVGANNTFTHDEFGILLPRDMPLKLFVDQWLNINLNSGFVNETVNRWLNYDW